MGKKRIKIKDPLEIHNALRKLKNQKATFFTWKKGSPEKTIFLSKIQKIEFDAVVFKPTNQDGYEFTQKDEIVFYCRDVNIGVIAKPKVYHDLKIRIAFPKELVIPSDDELEELDVLYLEDRKGGFTEKRTEERKGPEIEKIVNLKKATISLHNPPTIKSYVLKDLSPNGASFLVDDPGEFTPGTEVELYSVDNEDLEDILVGEVKSVREMKDHRFKVGLQLTYKKKRRGAA